MTRTSVHHPHLCLLGDANSVHLRRWAQEMQARGFRVSMVTARPQPLHGVEQQVLAPVHRSTDWLLRVGQARRAVAALAPDIVHAHYITSYGYLAARLGRRPLVMTAWGSDILLTPQRHLLLRQLTGWTLRQADLITGDSLDLVDEIARYRPRRAPLQVHWGADMARFRPLAWSAKTGFDIVSLRSWEPNYRIGVIVAALAWLCQRRPDLPWRLLLLGGGALEAALRSQVAALGLQDRVVFHGRVGDQAMVDCLQAGRVSVSVPLSDATSVSVLESMACGLPVVASDLPANRQWLDPALLLPAAAAGPEGDAALAEALADRLLWLSQDTARAEAIGQVNHQRMLAEGARSVQMDHMARLYHQLLQQRPLHRHR